MSKKSLSDQHNAADLEAKRLRDIANAAPQDGKAEADAKAAEQKADDLKAKVDAESGNDAATAQPTTSVEAGTLAVVDPSTPAGDHFAQKFGNDPANPKLAPGLDPKDATVRMSRVTPDHPGGPVFTDVHPDMVGDYARAGWNKVDAQAIPNS